MYNIKVEFLCWVIFELYSISKCIKSFKIKVKNFK